MIAECGIKELWGDEEMGGWGVSLSPYLPISLIKKCAG
jgi:hypothetical protein